MQRRSIESWQVDNSISSSRPISVARKLGLSTAKSPTTTTRDNNPKITRPRRSSWLRFFYPEPHGASSTNLKEFAYFARSRWIRRFHEARFDLHGVRKGPVASGYGLGLERLRRILERMGFASEFIYVATKRGASSPFSQYFLEGEVLPGPQRD